jgi:hypothetical protein
MFTILDYTHNDILRFYQRAREPVFGVLDRHRRPHRNHHRHAVLYPHLSGPTHLDVWAILAVFDMAGRSSNLMAQRREGTVLAITNES